MATHHHTKIHSSWSIHLRSTGQNMIFTTVYDMWPWPFRQTLNEQKKNYPLIVIHRHSFQLVHSPQKYRPKHDFHKCLWPVSVTLTFAATHDKYESSLRAYTSPCQKSFNLVKSSQRPGAHLTDGQMDRQTDSVKPVYPPLLYSGGYKNTHSSHSFQDHYSEVLL